VKKLENTIHRSTQSFQALSRELLNLANLEISQFDFFHEILLMLIDYSDCDQIELWLQENDKYHQHRISKTNSPEFEIFRTKISRGRVVPILPKSILNDLRLKIFNESFPGKENAFTPEGSFWIRNLSTYIQNSESKNNRHPRDISANKFNSLIMIPLLYGDERIGLFQLMCQHAEGFTEQDVQFYENVAQILGICLINQRMQSALRERVKELSCLYSINKIAEQHVDSVYQTLEKIVKILPPAWQYPEITKGRIVFDGIEYDTVGFGEDCPTQKSLIIVDGEERGFVEVAYLEDRPEIYEGPFLEEERKLIDTIANQIALIIERRESENERMELQEQLRHADRLATIGQLAAGVAHELNEPLGNILGFAQLIKKNQELSLQTIQDLEKIIRSSLNAREIIKKLMLFARQLPPNKTEVNINNVVDEGIYFFDARCAKTGIELIKKLAKDIPTIIADEAQLNQVLVNLTVNAIQAMPDGGKLTISTITSADYVSLIVEDTGIGMSETIKNKIFIPFFTTKEINEGTGLGLAVVHGIITSHRGKIWVESSINHGTRFEIQLPR